MAQSRASEQSAPLGHLPPLEPLEVCSGMVFGRRRSADPRTRLTPSASTDRGTAQGHESLREVLEELLLPALSRPPCRVAFSGGRDSSALLATATCVARRHGLSDPVPVTLRYEQYPSTWETDWQEMTVRHLGLDRWDIISLTSEVDAVGPIARAVLRRHGLYWPPNAQAVAPLLQAAAGETLITGNGGDEVFSPWIWRRRRVSLTRIAQIRPRRRGLKYMTLALIPTPLRIRFWCRRAPPAWLRPAAKRKVQRLYLAKLSDRSPNFRVALERLSVTRNLELTHGIYRVLAREAGARLLQPFLDPRFLRAAADAAPRDGFPSRSGALEAHFGDLLPPAAIQRSTKTSFSEVFFGPSSRAFAERWDGTGLDLSLIDPDALRREWSKPHPDFRSMTPLQTAWLASRAQD